VKSIQWKPRKYSNQRPKDGLLGGR
jgi:hypothetical protein